MKILQINIFGDLSTGRIAVDIYRTLLKNGHESKIAFARNTIANDVKFIKIGNDLDVKVHGFMTRITDRTGFYSKRATKKLIHEIKDYNPDLIHLHNIHGYYINIELLFDYLKKSQKPVVWTLHDCWAFTGHCCHFDMANCDRWIKGCHDCPQKGSYPASKLIDNSKWNYHKKRELFQGANMTLVAVSEWLATKVRQSFLQDYPLKVIHNGVDLDVFKPTESDFREKHGLEDKLIILGVASTWDEKKGLKDFIELSRILDDRYKVVVVGVNEKEKSSLPKNMVGIMRTNNIQELAGIYSSADWFFNASVEETFGLPTVEAMACGTPVIVYNATALPEVVDIRCGYIIEKHDLNSIKALLENEINANFSDVAQSSALRFEISKKYRMYLKLYDDVIKK